QLDVTRIKLDRFFVARFGFLPPAEPPQNKSAILIYQRAVRQSFSCLVVSRERAVEVAEDAVAIRTLCDPRFTGIGGKGHGAISGLLDRIGRIRAQVDGIEVEKAAQDC